MQHANDTMQHATDTMQHATDTVQQTTDNRRHAKQTPCDSDVRTDIIRRSASRSPVPIPPAVARPLSVCSAAAPASSECVKSLVP
jgi:hypothetical protein